MKVKYQYSTNGHGQETGPSSSVRSSRAWPVQWMSIQVYHILLLVVALLMGCSGTQVPASPLSPVAPPSATPPNTPVPTATAALTATFSSPPVLPLQPGRVPVPGSGAARAVADLAARLEVEPEIIDVVRIITDDFPAQNLGCPLPGGKTPEPVQPAFVMGQEIVLAVEEQQYVYHAHGGVVVFCGKVPARKLPLPS